MKKQETSLGWQVGLFVLSRTGMNTAMRMVYPFLGIFAAGLGVSIETISLALFLRAFLGVISPLAAPLADRISRKFSILLGTGVFTLGALLPVLSPAFGWFVAALVLMNLGVFIFLPALQAYLGDRVPYQRRGLVLGLTELSWSLSTILGVPIAAGLISSGGWRAPFPWLSGFGLVMIGLTLLLVPAAAPASRPNGTLFSGLGIVLQSPRALTLLGMGLCFTFGNEIINLLFGVWLEDRFDLKIGALGAVAALIGLAELGGEGLSTWLADKMGKANAVRAGILGNILSALALVLLGRWEWGAILALFLFYLSFEFMLVSSLPLISEVLPQARATLMAANIMFFSLGRALAAVGAPWLYAAGFWLNAAGAVGLNLAGLYLLGRGRFLEKSGDL